MIKFIYNFFARRSARRLRKLLAEVHQVPFKINGHWELGIKYPVVDTNWISDAGLEVATFYKFDLNRDTRTNDIVKVLYSKKAVHYYRVVGVYNGLFEIWLDDETRIFDLEYSHSVSVSVYNTERS